MAKESYGYGYMETRGRRMRCVRCSKNYIGMRKAHNFNCPHCGGN